MSSALLAFLHHAAAFLLVGILVAEHLLFDSRPSLTLARRLMRLDLVYGISAMSLLAVGLVRALYFEKGWTYYVSNPYFLTKVGLFIVIAALSAYPTMVFLSWRKAVAAGQAPQLPQGRARTITVLMRLQLVLVVGILYCAAMMAKGIA